MTLVITDPAELSILFPQALNAGDVDGVLALLAPDISMRTVAGELISGLEALRQEITGTVAAHGKLTNVSRHTILGADTALVITDWTLEVDAPDGTRVAPTGTTANVAQRFEEGGWRFTVLNPLGTS